MDGARALDLSTVRGNCEAVLALMEHGLLHDDHAATTVPNKLHGHAATVPELHGHATNERLHVHLVGKLVVEVGVLLSCSC